MHVLGIKSPAYLPVWFPPDVAAARGTPHGSRASTASFLIQGTGGLAACGPPMPPTRS